MAERLSRRAFLGAAARLAVLGGLGALVVRLVRRVPAGAANATARQGETCINDGLCRACGGFAGCGLPAALSAKQRAPWARGRS